MRGSLCQPRSRFREFRVDEGQKSETKASCLAAALARQEERLGSAIPDAGAGRGKDRRRPQAGAARGRLRSADCGDLSRRRIEQARAFIGRESRPSSRDQRHGRRRDHKSSLQKYLQSHAYPLPGVRVAGTLVPIIASVQVEVVVRGEAIATATDPAGRANRTRRGRRWRN